MFMHPHGPCGGFVPREWQNEFREDYFDHLGRHRGHDPKGQHTYCLYAGTGSGKTKAAAWIVSELLNTEAVNQVVFVCPNRTIIDKTKEDFREYMDIDLGVFDAARKRDYGVNSIQQGYATTYQSVFERASDHARLCARKRGIVIFDEVHHLGDESAWGKAAVAAFGSMRNVLCLTGTPYRPDNSTIPFVTYESSPGSDLWRFKPDFTYNLGRAVADGVCRDPHIHFTYGNVKCQLEEHEPARLVSFDETDVDDRWAAARRRGAAAHGSTLRTAILEKGLGESKRDGRRTMIFVGGDRRKGGLVPTEDAMYRLPEELKRLGYSESDYEVVVGETPGAARKLNNFGRTSKSILISVDMVSEGVDIPQLSAAIFLTNETALQTTVQRIGRVLRLMGPDDPHKTANIYMFADPDLIALEKDLRHEIKQERKLATERKAAKERATGDQDCRFRPMAIGVGDADHRVVAVRGKHYLRSKVEALRDDLVRRGAPVTEAYLMALLKLEELEDRNVDGAA